MKSYHSIGVQSTKILLPRQGINPQTWAVIACDQFTSQPEYWKQVEGLVGDTPSTLHMILPEVYLGKPDEPARILRTQQTMQNYLDNDIFTTHDGFILVERNINGRIRRGLMMALDLERYDFSAGSQSLIRATEGTILDRLPPRMRIREGAPVEIPHILVLIDDPICTVIEPLLEYRPRLKQLYDFDLMMGSGHLTGYSISDPAMEHNVVRALENLTDPNTFYQRYGVDKDKGILLFAVGDGNHSLATAKSIWEKIKSQVGMNHPARFALVEIENLHDEALEFEPIHRVLFGIKQPIVESMKQEFGSNLTVEILPNYDELTALVQKQTGQIQRIGLVEKSGNYLLSIQQPTHNLAVGTLQAFLDKWIKQGGAEKIDYVHGTDVLRDLGCQEDCAGFYVPAMQKSELFKTVIVDGVLPRKTFSMGEAKEKRFYMECKRIA
jgi:hypothetical protein